jgi:hypothetical protein
LKELRGIKGRERKKALIKPHPSSFFILVTQSFRITFVSVKQLIMEDRVRLWRAKLDPFKCPSLWLENKNAL